MRSTKELLTILRDNIHRLNAGLCLLALDLRNDDTFSHAEWREIAKYIDNHRPSRHSEYQSENYAYGGAYYWRKGEKEIRVAWLNNRIKKWWT